MTKTGRWTSIGAVAGDPRRAAAHAVAAAAHPWPRALTSKGKTKPCYTSPSFRSSVGPAERTSPPASRCRAAARLGQIVEHPTHARG
jgi:hypothetical protein